MHPDNIDHDGDEIIGLLQPFVDGELTAEEHARVAAEIAANPEYQEYVESQQRVRAALRELVLVPAPAELRARVRADLDAVDHERAGKVRWLAPVIGRLRAFGKGTMLMMPAAAAALVLFFVVRNGSLPGLDEESGSHVDGALAGSLVVRKPQQAQGGFPVQVAPSRALPSGVELVSDSDDADSTARVRYRSATGEDIVDLQRPLALVELQGTRRMFRGHVYHLDRDARGHARVEFVLGSVHHSLALEGRDRPMAPSRGSAGEPDPTDPDFRTLLELAAALRQAHER